MNEEIANIFYEIADILEMKEVRWKPQAYRKAARALESLDKDVKDIYNNKGEKGLEDISGVGKAIAKKIIQYIKKGKVDKYEKLKKFIPRGVEKLMKVPGLGAKTSLKFYKKLGIKSIEDLEKAAKQHKIRDLEGFKSKTEENILKNIKFIKKTKGRKLLGHVLPTAKKIESELQDLREVKKAVVGGSVRRKKETVGDLDILVELKTNSKKKEKEDSNHIVDYFINRDIVNRVIAKGQARATIITKNNLQVDIRIIKSESFGSALQYFTGNKQHNIHLRKIAQKNKLKLNEYGIFKGKKQVAGKTEREVYEKLGMSYIEPELRTDSGEIEAAQEGKLPKLINYKDIKGDLHVHSKWSDGRDKIEEIAKKAKQKGYKYIGISDHLGNMKIANALNKKRLEKRNKEIDKLNKKIKGIKILKGAEVDIAPEGDLSADNQVLRKLDVVIASVHSKFKMSKKEMTDRILRAMDNKYVDIIGHPTGRMIEQRQAYELDFEKIFKKAKKNNIALEINSYPERLDLNGRNIRQAVEKGVKLVINTDSHNKNNLNFIELGGGIARRGWAEKKDIINTGSLSKLEKFLKK
jgi:DNA polymerase (family 10)